MLTKNCLPFQDQGNSFSLLLRVFSARLTLLPLPAIGRELLFLPRGGSPHPMTSWCKSIKVWTPWLNLGHFSRTIPCPELPLGQLRPLVFLDRGFTSPLPGLLPPPLTSTAPKTTPCSTSRTQTAESQSLFSGESNLMRKVALCAQNQDQGEDLRFKYNSASKTVFLSILLLRPPPPHWKTTHISLLRWAELFFQPVTTPGTRMLSFHLRKVGKCGLTERVYAHRSSTQMCLFVLRCPLKRWVSILKIRCHPKTQLSNFSWKSRVASNTRWSHGYMRTMPAAGKWCGGPCGHWSWLLSAPSPRSPYHGDWGQSPFIKFLVYFNSFNGARILSMCVPTKR